MLESDKVQDIQDSSAQKDLECSYLRQIHFNPVGHNPHRFVHDRQDFLVFFVMEYRRPKSMLGSNSISVPNKKV